MAHIYDIGTRAWQPDTTEGWVASEVTDKQIAGDKVTLVFTLENGETKTVETTLEAIQTGNDDKLPPLMNPAMLEASDDLTNLSHLNEPAVLQAIKLRYLQKEIYTYSGIVLIATNPFARVDSLYVPGMVQVYAGKQRSYGAPHLFAIAEEAFADMLRDQKNQTIVVSGESGAGKTVSAKYIMRYFATRESPDNPGKRRGKTDQMSETEEQILATNPIMEAFGNAKTTRNDNSSRFGKYIEIMFNKQTDIIGAKIRTYLLERSRLVFQPLKERNYHVFYQLVAGATDEEREQLSLKSVEEFSYLNQGSAPVIEGMDDVAEFKATKQSLTKIGVSSETQDGIWRLLAALLHMGDVKITATRTDSNLSPEEPSLVKACALLGIDANTFAKWIVKKQLITRGEKIVSNLTQQQAIVVRDSVAKFIYSSLFDWLVERTNESLATEEVIASAHTFIGVLDIYGFEHFAKNSFEQFCINYANEKLQQEFNAHVFKLEQEEYMREKIDWTFIDFADNQPCIDLIEGKLGILSLLDEESRLPMGSDEQFVTKLHHNYSGDKHKFYKKPRFGKSAFTVCHYAVDVTYESDGFIEKNRDTVPDEHMEVLKASSNKFLTEVLDTAASIREKETASTASAKPGAAVSAGRRVATNRKPTLGGIFKSSLIELMQTINSTDVHYIRCIKPNEAKAAWQFDGPMVLSQLRACGVLETVRISCAGYPTRWTYEEFALRYYMLVRSSEWTPEIRNMATAILKKALGTGKNDGTDKYQMGLTKIFFRAGMLAFLENLRTARLNDAAVMIQKNLRAKYYRRVYLEMREAVISVQSLARGYMTRERAEEARQVRAGDDPKARFLDELDEELPDRGTDAMVADGGTPSRSNGQWKSVKTLDQFWEFMAFRQECSSGRIVGFIWVVITPPKPSIPEEDEDVLSQQSLSQPLLQNKPQKSTRTPKRPKTSQRKKEAKLKYGPIPLVLPKIKSRSSHLSTSSNTSKSGKMPPETSPYWKWPASSRGTICFSLKNYDRAHEVLLQQTFANRAAAARSTKKWKEEIAVLGGVEDWGFVVTGRKEFTSTDTSSGAASGVAPTIVMGVRKKRKPNGSAETTNMAQQAVEPVQELGAGTVRKKAKTDSVPPTDAITANRVNTLTAGLVRKKPKT